MNNTKIKGSASNGLLGATIAFFVGFAAVALFGPTAVKFKALMQLTPIQAGFLVAMPMLSGSLLRIPFGAWVESNGGVKPIRILLCLSVIGLAGLALFVNLVPESEITAAYYPLLIILALLSGCGIATFSPGIGQTSYWFPQKTQGAALGAFGGYGNIAPGIFSLFIPFAIAAFDLSGAYIIWLVILVIGVILYFKIGCNAWFFQYKAAGKSTAEAKQLAQKDGQEIFPEGGAVDSLKLACSEKSTWLFVIIYFTTFGGFLALTAWLPTYWHGGYGFGKMAGVTTGLFAIISSIIRAQGGKLADNIGGVKGTTIGLVILAIGAFIMAEFAPVTMQLIGALGIAAGMGITNASVFKVIPEVSPHAVSGVAGLVGGLGALGGFVIPPIMSKVIGNSGASAYHNVLWIFVALAIISIISNLILGASVKKSK